MIISILNQIFLLGVLGTQELLIILVVMLLPLILFIWSLVDIISGTFKEPNNKLIWVIVVILLPLLGSILYLIIGRSQKVKQ